MNKIFRLSIIIILSLLCNLAAQAQEGLGKDSALFSAVVCPGENCSRSMNISWGAIENTQECYLSLREKESNKIVRNITLKASDGEICTVFNSVWSKMEGGKNFYENARFLKFGYTFNHLKPATEYYCLISTRYIDVKGVSLTSPLKVLSFKTAGSKEWSCCIISDYHSYPPLPKRLASAMAMVDTVRNVSRREGREFEWVLHLGDVCAWGGSYSFWRRMYEEQNFNLTMWAGLNGNHDNMTRQYILTNEFFRNATANPRNGYSGEEGVCYWFTYGDVLFVMLNSDNMRKSEDFERAYNWTRKVLKKSRAKFKVVCEHYEWFNGKNGKTVQYGRWKKLFDECGVDLALAANNHIYVRSRKLFADRAVSDNERGTVYLQTPSSDNERGEKPFGELTHNQDLIAKRWNEGPKTVGAVLMDVTPNSITLTLLNRRGEKEDRVTITK